MIHKPYCNHSSFRRGYSTVFENTFKCHSFERMHYSGLWISNNSFSHITSGSLASNCFDKRR